MRLPIRKRPPGRPKGSGKDHARALQLLAHAICDRKVKTVRGAFDSLQEKHPENIKCSERHLRRLYAAQRKQLEEDYMSQASALWYGLTDFPGDQELLREQRSKLIALIYRFCAEQNKTMLVVGQPAPVERWTIQELEEFLIDELGQDPYDVRWDAE